MKLAVVKGTWKLHVAYLQKMKTSNHTPPSFIFQVVQIQMDFSDYLNFKILPVDMIFKSLMRRLISSYVLGIAVVMAVLVMAISLKLCCP